MDYEALDYPNKTQSEKFLRAAYFRNKPTVVGKKGKMGVFCDLPILKAEYYLCDQEPTVKPHKGLRLVIWNRRSGVERPRGWLQMRINVRYTALAIVDLLKGDKPYYRSWSDTARSSRSKWLTQTDYEIIEIDVDNFMLHYDASIVHVSMREIFKKQIYDYISVYTSDVHFFLARDMHTKSVTSGFCCVDDFKTKQSLHLVAFRSKEDALGYIGVGLIDYWMNHAQQVGLKYANLGVVWQKGDPKSWIGYSNFKMHFKPTIYTCERPLFKVTWR